MTTQVRDFKFAGAIVVVGNGGLTLNFFSAHYAWFSRGCSHVHAIITTVKGSMATAC